MEVEEEQQCSSFEAQNQGARSLDQVYPIELEYTQDLQPFGLEHCSLYNHQYVLSMMASK